MSSDAVPGAADELPDDVSFDIPDDLSGLSIFGETTTKPTVALVLTQVAGADPLAAVCTVAKLEVDVFFAQGVGAVAVCRDLDGDGPAQVAAGISQLISGVPAILVERRENQITATRWLDGERGDDIPAGLLLDGAPDDLEGLLLGTHTLADIKGVLPAGQYSRLKAARLLASLARKARKKS
ncbi:hypothetical protein ATL41_0558 [Flavimobilis soli]|uniref:Uncharacterized protein n=1 Tax=Flavimobilis soli TaxID=442709 RepID=A0A2A9EA72_9MICO|nr:hypothetical protein [Flavimobilis soli]PFG35858.1 hypothetical protein ATL41_0558 [Flavimobilis soli]